MLRECYRPTFNYRETAPPAMEAWIRFTREFKFLPDCTSEPERLARMVQRLIYQQRRLRITPPECPRHEIAMVMLGQFGYAFITPKGRLSMHTLQIVGNGGRLLVAKGIFRCPHPGCFLVAPVEDSGTMQASC